MLSDGIIILRDVVVVLIVALIVSALITGRLIPVLKRLKTTQTIHEDAPEGHALKSGTPTMGGISIIVGLVCGCAVLISITGFSLNLIIILIVTLIFGAVGFLDDYTKVVKRRNLGLTAKQKLVLQVVVALLIALYAVFIADIGTRIMIPFIWKYVNISYWIIPYYVFIIVAMVNAVNLTDGLDGLASGVTTVVSLFYPILVVLAFALGGVFITTASTADEIIAISGDALYFSALAGACLGFLIYNRHPAKIFMGDTGSLAIGGGIATAAILCHLELLLPIVGLIFVLEVLSDIIQVASYKLRHGKRVFKMAPLHHHFELSGYKETKVVGAFITVTIIICVVILAVMALQLGLRQ
jgi:phospho-N-acetylmuramoyl-pentapeptide-transferase